MKNEGPSVLVVADRTASRRLLCGHVQAAFPRGHVEEASTAEEAITMLRRRDFEIILADHAVGLTPGAHVLDLVAREHPWTMRVLVGNGAGPGNGAHAVLPPDATPETAAATLRALLRATS